MERVVEKAGQHQITWNTGDDGLEHGTYIYIVRTETQKYWEAYTAFRHTLGV